MAKNKTEEKPEPKQERFVCNRYKSLGIGVGHKGIIKFRDGELITDDPEIIEAVKEHNWFNLFIVPDNPKLRKKRR